MELTVFQVAGLLGRTTRSVRYMIKRGQLPARKKGRTYFIPYEAVPLTEAQRKGVAQLHSKAREVVDSVFPPQSPGEQADRERKPEGSADGKEQPVRYSVRNLAAFQAALRIYGSVRSEAAGTQLEGPNGIAPADRLLAGMKTLSAAYYLFDPHRKRERLEQARECFTQALAELAVLQHLGGLSEAAGEVCETAIASLEGHVLPTMAGLIRHSERTRGKGKRGEASR